MLQYYIGTSSIMVSSSQGRIVLSAHMTNLRNSLWAVCMCVCVCVCVCVCACERERESVCVCVCVCVRERERETVCVCVSE